MAKKTEGESASEIKVNYRDHKGEPTSRVFSQEVHGENFAKLAEEFKASNAEKILPEDEAVAE